MKKQVAMTEVGQLLDGKEAEFHFKKLSEVIDLNIAQLERKAKSGLSKEDFSINKEHIGAWNCAKLICQTIKLFHASK